jgi:hypothetical protein
VTGETPGATVDENGQYVTDLSTMAYADSYLYLTFDDQEGSKSNLESMVKMYSLHK